MTSEPSTPNMPDEIPVASVITSNNENHGNAAAVTPSITPDQSSLFIEAYDCAKNNHNWTKVSTVISNHPDWLTRIPQGRRWTMLHQIVYCGNILHLDEILAYQISNGEFRFLCKSLDDKTVREVATERAHIHPQMLRRVERLVANDQLLHNAKDNKWGLVRQFLLQQPDIVNEKPPYKKLYLAHYLALTGQLDMFKELSDICEFKLDLIVDNKTINQIARENNHIEFAEHIEELYPNINEITTNNTHDAATGNNSDLPYPTHSNVFSQGFYDDPGIMIFSLNSNTLGNMFLLQDESVSYHNHSANNSHYATHNLFQDMNPTTITMTSTNDNSEYEYNNNKKSKTNISSSLTDEEQEQYEATVMENIKKFSTDNLLKAVTCCITKAVLRDPVVAADGFTYEREAILNWFEHSNRSPMTNQELQNQELKPNHAIKSILQLLTDTNKQEIKAEEKTKTNSINSKK